MSEYPQTCGWTVDILFPVTGLIAAVAGTTGTASDG